MVESGCKSDAPSEPHVSEAALQIKDKVQPKQLVALADNFCQGHIGVSDKRGMALSGHNSD